MAARNAPRLGFIGFGEAGPLIAKGLLAAGLAARHLAGRQRGLSKKT